MDNLKVVENDQLLFELRPSREGTWRIRLDDKEYWLFIWPPARKYVENLPRNWNPIETVLETCPEFNAILYHLIKMGVTFSKVEVGSYYVNT